MRLQPMSKADLYLKNSVSVVGNAKNISVLDDETSRTGVTLRRFG